MERHDLDYAHPNADGDTPGTSRLAIASLALGIVGSPCLTAQVNWHELLATHFALYGPKRYLIVTWLVRLMPLLAILLGGIALGRMGRRGHRRGRAIALAGIALGLFWLLLMYLAELMMRNFTPG